MPNKNSHFEKTYRFAVLAADVVFFTLKEDHLWVRLTPVNIPPFFKGLQGLPGGLLLSTETVEDTAARLLRTKANVDPKKVYLEQVATFSRVDRDPRGRVVAVAELGLVPWEALSENERKNTNTAQWVRTDGLPKLAYDHKEIYLAALDRLRSRLTYTTLVSKLLPTSFTLGELEAAYETILNRPMDKRNFRKKIKKVDVLVSLNQKRTGQKWRPAALYMFKAKKVEITELL